MSQNLRITSNSVQRTLDIGKKIAANLYPGDIICLFGSLGSGKTHLVKGIAMGLGAGEKEVNSPSFVLLKQYSGRLILNHFDLYRLKQIKEILNLGFDEYIYSDNVSVIEWAERLKGYLPREFLKIELLIIAEDSRQLNIQAKGARYKNMLKAFRKV